MACGLLLPHCSCHFDASVAQGAQGVGSNESSHGRPASAIKDQVKTTPKAQGRQSLALLEHEPSDELNNIADAVKIKATLDSGAVAHVTMPSSMPHGVKVQPNTSGRHFTGANGDVAAVSEI